MESIAETSCLSDDVKESVTNDFSWIRDEAFQEMGGRDYEDQTDLARSLEDVAKGILRNLGLPTETEANLDLDVGELPGDPVDLFRAIWDEATSMMIQGLAASPCCARKILHLARAVEQWHEAAGTNQLRRVALGSETGSSFTEMTGQGPTQVTEEAVGTWTGDSVRNAGSAAVRIEQLDVIEEEAFEESALLFCNEGEKQAIVKEIQDAAEAGEGLCPACRRVLHSEPGHTCEKCFKVILPTSQPQTYSCFVCQWSICFDCRLPQQEQQHMDTDDRWRDMDMDDFEMEMEAMNSFQIGGTRLHLAAQEGDVPGLEPLLTPGTNINCRDFSGKTPLHSLVSSWRCSLEAVGFLLDHGADVAARDNVNKTPLHEAAEWGDKEVVDLLIRRRADVSARDKHNRTPLHVAAEWGDKEVVDLLIRRRADVSARDKHNRTPLHVAAELGNKTVLDLLIQRGADVAACDNDNQTPLHAAALIGHKEVLDLLIQHGADVTARDEYNKTPLHEAAEWGDKEAVDLLIQCRADVAARDRYNKTPLHLAARSGRKENVNLLIQRGADVSARDTTYLTPLFLAAEGGHKEVVDLLIQRGADVAAEDSLNQIPLHVAAHRGQQEVSVAACGEHNRTPLHVAALIGHMLIQHGAGSRSGISQDSSVDFVL